MWYLIATKCQEDKEDNSSCNIGYSFTQEHLNFFEKGLVAELKLKEPSFNGLVIHWVGW